MTDDTLESSVADSDVIAWFRPELPQCTNACSSSSFHCGRCRRCRSGIKWQMPLLPWWHNFPVYSDVTTIWMPQDWHPCKLYLILIMDIPAYLCKAELKRMRCSQENICAVVEMLVRILLRCIVTSSPSAKWDKVYPLSAWCFVWVTLFLTQQNSYCVSHPLGTVTTQWLDNTY